MKQAADQEKRLASEVTEIESEVRNVMNNLQICSSAMAEIKENSTEIFRMYQLQNRDFRSFPVHWKKSRLCIRMRRTGFWAKMAAVPAIVEKKVCQISAIRLMR